MLVFIPLCITFHLLSSNWECQANLLINFHIYILSCPAKLQFTATDFNRCFKVLMRIYQISFLISTIQLQLGGNRTNRRGWETSRRAYGLAKRSRARCWTQLGSSGETNPLSAVGVKDEIHNKRSDLGRIINEFRKGLMWSTWKRVFGLGVEVVGQSSVW